MNRPMRFARGIILGAGLMYMLDPSSGRRRRALVRDKLVRGRHEIEGTATAKSEFIRDKAYGAVAETRSLFRQEEVDNHTLEDRVRSQLGRVTSHMGTIHVSASDGEITLHGSVPANEIQDVVRTAEGVRGVIKVDNRLHVQQEMAGGQRQET